MEDSEGASREQVLFQLGIEKIKTVHPALGCWLRQRTCRHLELAHTVGKMVKQRRNQLVTDWSWKDVIIFSHPIDDVFRVAREEFITTLARKDHFDILPCQLGDQIHA